MAFIAAGAFAVFPVHVREAHFTLTDTPLTCLTALTLLLSMRAAESARMRDVALAGAAIGLTAAIKYNGAVVCVMPALAALALPKGRRWLGLGVAAVASIVAFLVAAPYTLLDLPAFLNSLAFLLQSYNRPQATALGAAWIYVGHLRNGFGWPGVLPLAFGYVGLTLSVVGLLMATWSRRPQVPWQAAAMVVIFPAVYFWFVSNESSLIYGRYLLPIGPALAIGLGVGVVSLSGVLAERVPRMKAAVLPALVVVILGPVLTAAGDWSATHARPTTLFQAARWIHTRPTAGERVVIEDATVQVPPRVALERVNRLIDRSLDDYRGARVTYLVSSSEITDRHASNPEAAAAHQALVAGSDVVQVFAPNASRVGATFTILKIRP